MNKQEFQQNIKDMKPTNYINYINSITVYDAYNEGFEEAKQNVLFGSDFLDEPEKPVVPQFVADWLEVCKENLGFGLSTAMSHSTSAMKKQPNMVKDWFNLKDNQETFAKAWLFGYEVEKEKLYTVEIPNPNSKGTNKIYLCKDDTTGKVYLCKGNFNPSKNRNLRLTEAEIKEDFEWAWEFAKEVEE